MAKAEKIESKEVPPSERLLLDVQSAAEMLSISVRTLQDLPIAPRKLPGVSKRLYYRADLEAFVRNLGG